MPDYNWNDLKYVITVQRTGSLAAAARRLAVNERTVARRIAAIETQLQARLFDRSDAGWQVVSYLIVPEPGLALQLGAGLIGMLLLGFHAIYRKIVR